MTGPAALGRAVRGAGQAAAGSVRVRITAVVVTVTAVALAAGAWALLEAVERTQLARIARNTTARVDDTVRRLEAGTPPQDVDLDLADTVGFVRILAPDGDVLASAPAMPGLDLAPGLLGLDVVVVEQPIERRDASLPQMGLGVLVVDRRAGGGVVEAAPAGPHAGSPMEVRYRTIETASGTYTVLSASPLDEVRRSLDALRLWLIVGLPFLVALAGAVAWEVTKRALRPVEAVRREVEAISSSTLHRRVPEPGTDDELGRLARTMNATLDRFERAAERQRQLVADASHELRSPVAALRTELEVARAAGAHDRLRRAVDGALAEEARLEQVLADLLTLASIEEGKSRPDAVVDLADVVRHEAARPRRLPVAARCGQPALVRGSAGQLHRVVGNLVDSAARHAASVVELAVTGGGGRVVLTVDDDGPGVPEHDRERVFERFVRLDEARARDGGGTGLGLAVVGAAVVRHGGTVRVTDSPQGGSRFVVELPD